MTTSEDLSAAVGELQAIMAADGGELRVLSLGAPKAEFELVLEDASCAECVMPRDMLVEILKFRLTEIDPTIVEVDLIDPRTD
jgi:hypothetical protein